MNKLQENLLHLINLRKNAQQSNFKASDLVGKEIVHTWTVESGENRDWEGQIKSFDKGVYKVIEYQI